MPAKILGRIYLQPYERGKGQGPRGTLVHIMGKQKAFKKLHSTKKQLLTALVLSSILGMGFGAAPAWAESKTDQDTDSRTPLVSQVNGVGTVSNGSDTAVTDGLTAALAAWREDHEAVQLRQDSQGAGASGQ